MVHVPLWQRVLWVTLGVVVAIALFAHTLGLPLDPWRSGGSALGGPSSLTTRLTQQPTKARPRQDGSQVFGNGARLLPGDDGRLPVHIRWVHKLTVPEAFAVDHGVVYVSDESLMAFRLSDGAPLWQQYGSPESGLEADGGVSIGSTANGDIRVFGPWNFDLVANPRNGHAISFRQNVGGDAPADFTPFPVTVTTAWHFDTMRFADIVARDASGSVAWRIQDSTSMFDMQMPVDADGGWVLMTASGYLVALSKA